MDFTENAEADLTKVVDRLVDEMVANMSLVQKTPLSFSSLSLGSRRELDVSDSWKQIQDMMVALKGILPTVVDDMQFAQKEVQSVSHTLRSIFGPFKDKGPPIL